MAMNDQSSGYRGENNLLRPPSEEFQCSEQHAEGKSSEGSAAPVCFHCTVFSGDAENSKGTKPKVLTFYCREPSYGVLTSNEESTATDAPKDHNTQDDKADDNADDDFFDIGMMLFSEETYPYALAGRTGFQIWPGTRIMVDALTFPRTGDNCSLQKWQQALTSESSLRVLELGAGVGVLGASLAAAGAQVLLTDLAKVVEASLIPNLKLIQNKGAAIEPKQCPPTWLRDPSRIVVPIGRGWAAATSLDWTEPLDDQLTKEQQSGMDLIVASDCVWLVSMLEGLLETAAAIFQAAIMEGRRSPKLLLSFQRRDSEMFTTVDRVLAEIRTRQWAVECLAWYPVTCDEDEDDAIANNDRNQDSTTKEVFVFEVSPVTNAP